MTYLLISAPFLALALVIWVLYSRRLPHAVATTAAVGAVLLALTAAFDNLMILAGLVGYGSQQQLGIRVGLVPVEDFFYTIFVVLILSALWKGTRS
ncbi:lycopene cyclase domain-containing protein [Corynebacterium flavescens]